MTLLAGARRSGWLALILCVGMLLASCGDDDDASTDDPTADSAGLDLAGQTFESTEVHGHTLVPDTVISLSFEDGRISANAGCNTMTGEASWDDGKLTVPGELATTMMACPDELQAQDVWLANLLTSEPTLSLDGDTLVIGDSTMGLTLQTRKDLPLQGTAWTLDGLIANEAISTVPMGVEAGIEIDAQGTTMNVSAGCNTGSGSVTIEAGTDASSGTITVGPVGTTRKLCAEDAMAVETLVLSVLQGPVTYEIDGDALKLTKGDEGLTFTASD